MVETVKRDVIRQGKRVFLRHPVMEDAAEFLRLVKESRRLMNDWVSPPRSKGAFQEFVNRSRTETSRIYLVCHRPDRRIVGVFTLSQMTYGNLQSAYLGFYVGEEFSRQGYMTEGMGLVLKEAFGRLKLHRVEANIQPANGRSLRLVERCGFEREGYSPKYLKIGGRWRDHERWAIRKEGYGSRS